MGLWENIQRASNEAIREFRETPGVSALPQIEKDKILYDRMRINLKKYARRGWGWTAAPGPKGYNYGESPNE